VSDGRGFFGSVPAMYHSFTALLADGAGNPVNGSILTRTRPLAGGWKSVTGHFPLASWRNPCQT
jgi:hypothetical protein